ncbi:hypothetical protein RF11_12466 [Thelohanellus kitauei]|uniref:Uncharacterized protein n=1 Tax=Thelohanellus kitauei TaxID=669202 RepID=A0A0C2NGE4_THEKT|nr:hypothetical protein RF11_12466 [Thelohanellus kitauei]
MLGSGVESIQGYLDEKLTKVLIDALRRIVRDKPEDAIDYLIKYLVDYKNKQNQPPPPLFMTPDHNYMNYHPSNNFPSMQRLQHLPSNSGLNIQNMYPADQFYRRFPPPGNPNNY